MKQHAYVIYINKNNTILMIRMCKKIIEAVKLGKRKNKLVMKRSRFMGIFTPFQIFSFIA